VIEEGGDGLLYGGVIHQQGVNLVDFMHHPTCKFGFVNTDNKITSFPNKRIGETIWQPACDNSKRAAGSGKLCLQLLPFGSKLKAPLSCNQAIGWKLCELPGDGRSLIGRPQHHHGMYAVEQVLVARPLPITKGMTHNDVAHAVPDKAYWHGLREPFNNFP